MHMHPYEVAYVELDGKNSTSRQPLVAVSWDWRRIAEKWLELGVELGE
jgi:hypothetical protein